MSIRAGYAIYGEKPRAGLELFDRDRNPLYQASYPERAYKDFASIPPLVVDSLLFIEDHDLLDLQNPQRNPAVEWGRFMLAAAGRVASVVDRRFREGGASTLATQIEKFRHSPGGRTPGIAEKFRQMVTASARAYRDGPDTTAARRDIVTTYLNSTPLGVAARLWRDHRPARRRCGSGTAPISPRRTGCSSTPATTKAADRAQGRDLSPGARPCCSPAAGRPIIWAATARRSPP